MSSPPTIGSIDLESVLHVGRRSLVSIDETSLPFQQSRYTDTLYLKRQSKSNSLFSIDSKILISGELQLLCNIFERYKSTITIYENSDETKSNKKNVLVTDEKIENANENASNSRFTISTNRAVSSSLGSSSTLKVPSSTTTTKIVEPVGRTQRTFSITGDHYGQHLEGKRYGCVELPNMNLIEILEIFFRAGLELVREMNDYDKENVLHQSFIFSKPLQSLQKLGPSVYSR